METVKRMDWEGLGELVVFIVAGGAVGLVLACIVAAWFAARNRRIMWERYTQERGARLAERVDYGATQVKGK